METLSPFLSKEILLKSVISAPPTYAMQCFLIPKTICLQINSKHRSFWWQTSDSRVLMHYVNWQKMSQTKSDGGIGFQDLYKTNLALLTKQGWCLITQPQSLWAQLMKYIYFSKTDFLSLKNGGYGSWGRRSLLKRREVLWKGCH